MRRAPVRVALGGGAWLVLAACSVEETMPAPSCHESGSITIVAQSVPSAARIPCVDRLPDGWTTTSVRIDQDGTRIRFEDEGHGARRARLTFASGCDVPVDQRRAADPTPYQRFEGGCLSWEFPSAVDEAAREELIGAVVLVERELLEADLRRSFIDAEL